MSNVYNFERKPKGTAEAADERPVFDIFETVITNRAPIDSLAAIFLEISEDHAADPVIYDEDPADVVDLAAARSARTHQIVDGEV